MCNSVPWSRSASTFALRITAHDTDDGAKALFGDDVAGGRIEAALQASF